MTRLYDLSYPITDRAPCTFGSADKVPIVTYEEGDSHGLFFVTSRIDNLYSNAGTQIDFPAHLSGTVPTSPRARPVHSTVGDYPIERFVGTVAVLDFSDRMAALDGWFDERGVFDRKRLAQFERFVATFPDLQVSAAELRAAVERVGTRLEDLRGILVYSGSGAYWSHERLESWEYRYFYAPYFARDALEVLIENENISFLGVDAFQIEDPVANFRGDELPLVVNSDARAHVKARLASWQGQTNHEVILGNGLLIYESLNLPQDVVGTVGLFSGVPLNLQLPGLDDDALARPYFVLDK